MRSSLTPLAVLLLATHAVGAAQSDDVIVRYQKLLREPEQRRVALAPALAAVPGARGAALLRSELGNASSKTLVLALLDGLGKHGRPELADAVASVLQPSDPDEAVATAVGKALLAMGDAGVAPLQEQITRFATGRSNHRARAGVFHALVKALSGMTTPAALSAAANLARKGHGGDRARVLATLAKVDGQHGVHEARLDALQSDHAPLVLEGVRQLVVHDEAGIVATLSAAAARAKGPLEAPLLTGLAPIAAEKIRPELYSLFFTAAAASDATLSHGLRHHAAKLCADAGLARFVLARLGNLQTAGERALAARLIGALPGSEATAALIDMSQAREPLVAETAIASLGSRADNSAVPALRKLLRAPGAERRCAAMLSLHALLGGDDAWRVELRAAVADADVRLLALDLLAALEDQPFLPAAHALFTDRDWRTRAAAYDFCRRVRSATTIPLLLDRLAPEQGRMRQDVVDALAALTGLDLRTELQWRAWWRDHQATFVLPPVQPAGKARQRKDPGAGATRTYYSLPVVSEAVLFVVDQSGSMAAKVGTGNTSRLDEAKRQIVRVLESTPAGHRVGVISFDGQAHALQDKLVALDEKSRIALTVRVEALRIGSSTNVYDALRVALADPDVDTIYLLTDGAPSTGAIIEPEALRAAVAQWNRTRRVRIHCISLGTDSALLKGIAADAGGQYTSVR